MTYAELENRISELENRISELEDQREVDTEQYAQTLEVHLESLDKTLIAILGYDRGEDPHVVRDVRSAWQRLRDFLEDEEKG